LAEPLKRSPIRGGFCYWGPDRDKRAEPPLKFIDRLDPCGNAKKASDCHLRGNQ